MASRNTFSLLLGEDQPEPAPSKKSRKKKKHSSPAPRQELAGVSVSDEHVAEPLIQEGFQQVYCCALLVFWVRVCKGSRRAPWQLLLCCTL